ncbi:MAG: YraN family protein [bacterium]|nr:MAG: YraN family protein [bacterium]
MVEGAPGILGEGIAALYLELRGYRIIERNARAGRCEIDIVADDGGCLAFIEVKMRRDDSYGSAVEAINPYKLRNIRKAARIILARSGGLLKYDEIRFDLVAIDIDRTADRMVLRHLKGIA